MHNMLIQNIFIQNMFHTKYAHTKCVRAYIVCKYFVCKGREREGGREVEREMHKQKGGESDAPIE